MKLSPPIEQYLSGEKPSHTSRAGLSRHITFLKEEETTAKLVEAGYFTPQGKITAKAQTDGLVDVCEGKALWHVKNTQKALLAVTRKASKATGTVKPIDIAGSAKVMKPSQTAGPVWTDLENIGTYFGVGKNKIGTWLDELGLRGYKPLQVNESGDIDMLDIANQSKEKFKTKIPTEKALAKGYAQVEVVDYKGKGGKEKSFEKYSWNRDKVKDLLVRAGHELDTERKLLLKGKGKNSNVSVTSIDERVNEIYTEWKKLFSKKASREDSWKLLEKQSRAIQMRIEQKLGYPRFIQDKLYRKAGEVEKIML